MDNHSRCGLRRYNRSELLAIWNRGCYGIRRDVRRYLFILRLLHQCTHVHTRRPHVIPVRISNRCLSLPISNVTQRQRVLRPVARQERHHPCSRRGRSVIYGLLNVRSLNNKVEDIVETAYDASIDIFLITESWHDNDSNCIGNLQQLGFNVVHRPRPRPAHQVETMNVNHGGLLAFSRANIQMTIIQPYGATPSTFEYMCFRVKSCSSSNIVILIYRTGAIRNEFFDELSSVLDRVMTYSSPIIIAGDINMHMERQNDPYTQKLMLMMTTYGLSYCVTGPTHNLGGTIDVIFTCSQQQFVHITDPGISDHFLLRWETELPLPPLTYTTTSYRQWNQLSLSSFRNSLSNSNLCISSTWDSLDVDELAELYNTTIFDIIDHQIPIKHSRIPQRPSNPWFDKDCRQQKQMVRRLERYVRSCISPSAELLLEWKDNLQQYRSLLRRKRLAYWQSRIDSNVNTYCSLWQSVNSLMGRGRREPTQSLSADDFLDYFTSKASMARNHIANLDPPIFTQIDQNCIFTDFEELNNDDVLHFIRRLPNKFSTCDPIPTQLFKCCADLLSPFLTVLFRRSLTMGSFPSSWKRAVITPTWKKSATNSDDVSSYRPISKLPVLSKLLERIVCKQICHHINLHNCLPRLQSAYRKHHSTETAVLKIISDALKCIDNGQVCGFLSLDLSSAFDCVDFDILSRRLHESVGLQGRVHAWLESFVRNRIISVLHGRRTDFIPTETGVPQGSVLGPILFSLYVSDISNVVGRHGLQAHLYADDILITGAASVKEASNLCSKMASCLDDLKKWLISNRLHLNTDKTQLMWCQSPRRFPKIAYPIITDEFSVQPQERIKHLGVIIDASLSLESNISQTTSTCFSMLRRIRSIRGSLNNAVVKILVSSLVLNRLEYCISIHAGLPASSLARLQRVLHAAARLVYRATRYDHITPLLNELNWPSIKDRIDFRMGTLVYLIRQGLAPSYLSDDLVETSSVSRRQSLRSATSGLLVIPRCRHPTLGGRTFAVNAVKLWNSLPQEIRLHSGSVLCFKKLFKTYILSCK